MSAGRSQSLTPAEAEVLAERTLAAIDALDYSRLRADVDAADRERVASDRDLIKYASGNRFGAAHEWSVVRQVAVAGLLRTARLYGVEATSDDASENPPTNL